MSEVKRVKLSEIDGAPFNPPKRIRPNSLTKLCKSIEELGLLYPVLARKKGSRFELVDGHRRLAVCKSLGWEEIPVLISSMEPEVALRAYADVQSTSVRIGGNDLIQIYLSEPGALSRPQLAIASAAEEALGKAFLKKLADSGNSLNVFRFAKFASTYCENQSPAFIRKAARWCLKFKTWPLRKALDSGAPARVIEDAINKMQPILARYVTE